MAAAAAGVLVVVLVTLFTIGPFGSHLDRPGDPPLGYLRERLGGRQDKVTAWTLGDAASLKAAAAADAVDEVDFDWYHTQADGSVTAQDEDPDLVAAAREHDLNILATVTNSSSWTGARDDTAQSAAKYCYTVFAEDERSEWRRLAKVRLAVDDRDLGTRAEGDFEAAGSRPGSSNPHALDIAQSGATPR